MNTNISNYNIERNGRITRKGSSRPIKQSLVRRYLSASVVCDDGVRRLRRVHRMVAERFIENPLGLPEVNHKDEDKLNNSVENLEWCTRQYNAEYSLSKGFIAVSPQGEVVYIFNITRFCRENSLNKANLHKVCNGKRKSHKGWTRYVGDKDLISQL